ncbi:hypothetical protein IWX49DRAFT_561576 [Phyllosticta citricarpa]
MVVWFRGRLAGLIKGLEILLRSPLLPVVLWVVGGGSGSSEGFADCFAFSAACVCFAGRVCHSRYSERRTCATERQAAESSPARVQLSRFPCA